MQFPVFREVLRRSADADCWQLPLPFSAFARDFQDVSGGACLLYLRREFVGGGHHGGRFGNRAGCLSHLGFAPSANLQFNHFLVKDDEPLLYHTGLRGFHAEIREAVSKLINVSDLRHIGFSHFESDDCGSLSEWLGAAPNADVICSRYALRQHERLHGQSAAGPS